MVRCMQRPPGFPALQRALYALLFRILSPLIFHFRFLLFVYTDLSFFLQSPVLPPRFFALARSLFSFTLCFQRSPAFRTLL